IGYTHFFAARQRARSRGNVPIWSVTCNPWWNFPAHRSISRIAHASTMTPTRRFALAVSLIAAMTVIGAAGYMLIEHWPLLDAFYMSVITISTVGFGEVKPLSPAGRLFTIGLIVTGVGSAIYLFS